MDARVVKTKARLLETFKDMLGEMTFEDITVNDICKRAGIRRATFYKHFSDKYDFLRYFVGSLRDTFDKTIWKQKKPDATFDYYVAYIRAVVDFLVRNRNIVKKVLESDALPTVISIIEEQNYVDTKERLEKSISEGVHLPASTEMIATMMTGAVSQAIVKWFKDGMPIPAEEFIGELSSVIRMLAMK